MARVRKPKVDKQGRTSAGILLWRTTEGRLAVLLGHPGGPYFAGKDADHWTVLKGEVDAGEDLLVVARREFEEETGHEPPEGPTIELGEIRAASAEIDPGRRKWAIYWEVTDLRRLADDEASPVSDLSTEDDRRISPAFVPHGPFPIAG